jgi:diguanylate cyclase (GGDEF)-like protein
MKTTAINEAGRAKADLLVFHEIARALTSSQDLDSTLETILSQIQRVFRPETSALLLNDQKQRDLYYAIAQGRYGPRLSHLRVAFGEGMAGWVAEQGEPLIVSEDSGKDLPHPGVYDNIGFEVRSAACIPLRSRSRTVGVIQLFNLPSEMLSEYAISLLLVLCDFAAIAVENANSYYRVQKLTIVDECTGLFNVRHFEQSLKSEIARSERLGVPMSLIFFDLDHFKLVNDQYGHQVGNRLLAMVGESILSHIRSMDLAFRYGGDEFAILLPGTAKRQAVHVAMRLLEAFREASKRVDDVLSPSVTASFGLASYPEDGRTGPEILEAADARMYEVKDTTRDAMIFSGPGRTLERRA